MIFLLPPLGINESPGFPGVGLDCRKAVGIPINPVLKYVLLPVMDGNGPTRPRPLSPSGGGVGFGGFWAVAETSLGEVKVGFEADAAILHGVPREPISDLKGLSVVTHEGALAEVGGEGSHFVCDSYVLFLCLLELHFQEGGKVG